MIMAGTISNRPMTVAGRYTFQCSALSQPNSRKANGNTVNMAIKPACNTKMPQFRRNNCRSFNTVPI